MTDNEVLEYFSKWKVIPWKRIEEKYKEYLLNRFIDTNIYSDSINKTLSECLYRLKHNIENIPKCPICGKPVKSRIWQFALTCGDIKCSSKLQHQHYEENCLKKHGVTNYTKLPEVKEKMYNTCLKKYGCKSPLGNKDIWNLTRKHTIEKYGAAYNKEKFNETIMKRYGVKWFTQTDKLKHFSHTEEAEQKRYITSKRNGTLNTSKEENIIFKLLKVKFPDTICHYKDKNRYPFVCDFYIPSLDLFIEYQGSMFHNKRPSLGTEEDLKEVEEIKQKSKKRKQITGKQKTRYDSLIETWTIRDVNKRETAKKNNLNYLEFFTIIELQNWLNTFNEYEGDK